MLVIWGLRLRKFALGKIFIANSMVGSWELGIAILTGIC